MARAKGLLLLISAARAMTSHAETYGAPPTASISYATYAAASRALSAASGAQAASYTSGAQAASRALSATSGAQAASCTAYAAASGAPAIASRLLGSPAAPVGGGGNRYTLGIGALATFAAAAVMLTTDPIPEWELVPEQEDAQKIEDEDLMEQVVNSILGMEMGLDAARGASARRMKAKIPKNENFWKYLEDAVKKTKIVLEVIGVAKEVYALIASTVIGSILFIEKYGDPVHRFLCPYSGYSEVTGIFLFSVTPKEKTQQGDSSTPGPALQVVKCCFCEVDGKTIGSFLPKDHSYRKVIVGSLSEEEIAGLKEMFQTMDADGSGAITYDELKEGFKKYGSILKEVADVNNSGTIDRVEQACGEHNILDAFLDDVIKEADQDNGSVVLFYMFEL